MAKDEKTRRLNFDVVFNTVEKAWFVEICFADEPEHKITIAGPYSTQAEADRVAVGLSKTKLP